ncbi:MAG TPA: S8 family peptidase [Longimicrobium sp.]|nr:S8 family peptidase [Longimicrobium sp.]
MPSDSGAPEYGPPPQGSPQPLRNADPRKSDFDPEVLDRTVIAVPLLRRMRDEDARRAAAPDAHDPERYHVIIDLNLEFHGGREAAKQRIEDMVDAAIKRYPQAADETGIQKAKSRLSHQYLFATLTSDVIREIVRIDSGTAEGGRGAIYRVWPDFEIQAFISKSFSTVKADAARAAFAAFGQDIVWAVLDSGIDETHPHFVLHGNLKLGEPLLHRDFTVLDDEKPLVDEFGHGTHVAGIIAGEMRAGKDPVTGQEVVIRAVTRKRSENDDIVYEPQKLDAISGMAPRAKLASFKVLDGKGQGRASNLIAAIEQIQEINGFGRRLRIHGVNMSVGYDFEPEWFACGQSPLCVEVDRLVRSGVVVVVAAGNTGYGFSQTAFRGPVAMGMDLSINDPGNAQLAITVGSTHRDSPHIYGVSYFSSKGPTGDGRLKPDLVAPGEKILSCAAGERRTKIRTKAQADYDFVEESGTSMAAPHVSGVIAAFLSIRREFVGQPERVKEIFLETATDLGRDRYFQGRGLVDLMRAIQAV